MRNGCATSSNADQLRLNCHLPYEDKSLKCRPDLSMICDTVHLLEWSVQVSFPVCVSLTHWLFSVLMDDVKPVAGVLYSHLLYLHWTHLFSLMTDRDTVIRHFSLPTYHVLKTTASQAVAHGRPHRGKWTCRNNEAAYGNMVCAPVPPLPTPLAQSSLGRSVGR